MTSIEPPKVFVSYSWSTPEHEAWVLSIAKDLADQGVDVIIDKWSLGKGHDSYAFMEQMATNTDIKKVIIICDRLYAEKADGRMGGAGTEAQIITPHIYASQEQNKFVAVVAERDADGKPYVPAFYKSRIHIDLSDPTTFGSAFEELVRWVYDKPLHVKPQIGKPPAYILEEPSVRLGTSSYQRRAIEALRLGRNNSAAAVGEYLDVMLQELSKFRIAGEGKKDFDQEIMENVSQFIPYRDEYFELVSAATAHAASEEIITKFHRFLEGTIKYMYPSANGSYSDWDFDNFRFIAYEMYLGTVAILLRAEKFELANLMIESEFYVGDIAHISHIGTMNCTAFMHYLRSFEAANDKRPQRKVTIVGHMLHERSKHTYFEFKHLCAADVILHIRSRISDGAGMNWYAVTPIYLYNSQSALEIFARSKSRRYFDRAKIVLGVKTADEFRSIVAELSAGQRGFSSDPYGRGPGLATLTGADALCTVP